MRAKWRTLSAALGPLVLARSFLVGCDEDDKGYVSILSPDEMAFVVCAQGMDAPARLVTFESNRPVDVIRPSYQCYWPAYSSHSWNPSWRYPLRDYFFGCHPDASEAGAYTGTVQITCWTGPSIEQGACGGKEPGEGTASLPVHVDIIDPGSEPFPGFTRNGGEDVNYFHFVVPEGTPGLTTQTLEIVNQGGGTLTWTLASKQPWLSLDPFDGDTAAEQDVVNVNVNVAGLEAGRIHFGTITVTSNSPDLPTEEIVVVLQ